MGYALIKSLVDAAATFEQETGRQDLASFSAWLQAQYAPAARPAPSTERGALPHYDGLIVQSLSELQGHAKHYIKTAIRSSPLVSLHDFSFLNTLSQYESLRKTELIAHNYVELSPGMEVIRRLLRNGLIEDFDDPDDGRSKRVHITPSGKAAFERASETIAKASHIFTGQLSEPEKARLLALLLRLCQFHRPIWENAKGEELEEIIEKYAL